MICRLKKTGFLASEPKAGKRYLTLAPAYLQLVGKSPLTAASVPTDADVSAHLPPGQSPLTRNKSQTLTTPAWMLMNLPMAICRDFRETSALTNNNHKPRPLRGALLLLLIPRPRGLPPPATPAGGLRPIGANLSIAKQVTVVLLKQP